MFSQARGLGGGGAASPGPSPGSATGKGPGKTAIEPHSRKLFKEMLSRLSILRIGKTCFLFLLQGATQQTSYKSISRVSQRAERALLGGEATERATKCPSPLHANATAAVPSHFNQPGHSIADMELIPLEFQPTFSMSRQKPREAYLIEIEAVNRRSEPKE